MENEVKIKTVAMSPTTHKKLVDLKKTLKIKSVGTLIEKLVDEYHEVRT